LLVAPPRNTGETDYLLFNLTGDLALPLRTDMVEDDDVTYRVEGVGNTDNGLTWAWWTDVQDIEADVQYIPVGEDCVAPTEETIQDGTYPMGFPVRYYVAGSEFDNPMVRAFLWNFYTEGSLAEYAQRGYLGLDVDAMGLTQREDMYEMLAQVEVDLAAAAESTDMTDGDTTTDGDTESDAGADDTAGDDAPADDAGTDAGAGDDAGADNTSDSATPSGE
jgi:hypothetical protein